MMALVGPVTLFGNRSFSISTSCLWVTLPKRFFPKPTLRSITIRGILVIISWRTRAFRSSSATTAACWLAVLATSSSLIFWASFFGAMTFVHIAGEMKRMSPFLLRMSVREVELAFRSGRKIPHIPACPFDISKKFHTNLIIRTCLCGLQSCREAWLRQYSKRID